MAYTADLKCTAARLLSPPVDERALADVARDVEAQRTHVTAMCSAGGTATMASEHAPRIQSAGGKATVASHGAQIANGGKATVASHGAQMANGGTAGLGKKRGIYKTKKKPHQTAAQAANAAYQRKWLAAKRAKLAGGAH